MDRAEAIARLRARETELRSIGVERLSLFGSTARGDAGPSSDVDLAVVLTRRTGMTAFDFVGIQFAAADILGSSVDLISEPTSKPWLQAEIDRDRVNVF